MPCNESLDLPPTGALTMIYTAGMEAHFYRSIPIPTSGPCGTPVVHKDGSIEYPQGDPPEIQGYRKEGRRFYPAWPSCRFRTLMVTHPKGCIAVQGRCVCPRSQKFLSEVELTDCQVCEARKTIDKQ
jgi:hypothetical protein